MFIVQIKKKITLENYFKKSLNLLTVLKLILFELTVFDLFEGATIKKYRGIKKNIFSERSQINSISSWQPLST